MDELIKVVLAEYLPSVKGYVYQIMWTSLIVVERDKEHDDIYDMKTLNYVATVKKADNNYRVWANYNRTEVAVALDLNTVYYKGKIYKIDGIVHAIDRERDKIVIIYRRGNNFYKADLEGNERIITYWRRNELQLINNRLRRLAYL